MDQVHNPLEWLPLGLLDPLLAPPRPTLELGALGFFEGGSF